MAFILEMLKGQSMHTKSRQEAFLRISQDPGIPVSKGATESFWMRDPHPTVSKAVSTTLPREADVVVIGSGITGVAVAHELLDGSSDNDRSPNTHSKPSVVVLEAREASSGATGRNGGHIYSGADDYSELKDLLGQEEAMKIIRFRFAHLRVLISLAERYGITEVTQARLVESACVHLDPDVFAEAIKNYYVFEQDMPEEAAQYSVYHSKEAQEKFGLSDSAAGVITHPAGAIWPYKFTTALLARLQELHPDRFSLETETSVRSIVRADREEYPYQVTTGRGSIRAKHIIHCTNGHAGHLLPGLRGLIFPLRGQMSAQRPGNKFQPQGNSRSWIIHNDEGFDYLTQLPVSPPSSNGEMMLGGGILPSSKSGIGEIGASKDDTLNHRIKTHLSGTLQSLFQQDTWGTVDGTSITAMWTGIMGFSADGFPWVGQLPPSITGRELDERGTAKGGEWIAAGFSGEGMVHAWLCGTAVVRMLQNETEDRNQTQHGEELYEWFPKTFAITPERIARSTNAFRTEPRPHI